MLPYLPKEFFIIPMGANPKPNHFAIFLNTDGSVIFCDADRKDGHFGVNPFDGVPGEKDPFGIGHKPFLPVCESFLAIGPLKCGIFL